MKKSDFLKIQIVATDEKGTGQNSTADLVITIVDVNDQPPVFNNSSYAFCVSEDLLVEAVVGQVTASDLDLHDSVQYYMEMGDDGKFYVSHQTGTHFTQLYFNTVSGMMIMRIIRVFCQTGKNLTALPI